MREGVEIRLLANGPAIPDILLSGRDAGNVKMHLVTGSRHAIYDLGKRAYFAHEDLGRAMACWRRPRLSPAPIPPH